MARPAHQGPDPRRAPAPGPGGAPGRPRRGAGGPQADLPSGPDRGAARAGDGDRAGRRRQVTAGRRARAVRRGPAARSCTGGGADAWRTRNTSYSAFADAIKAQCEIFEDDSAEVAAGKAEAAARELFGDDSVAPQLRALVGAGETRDLSREELFEAWRRFLERLAARYPLVLVLEDIHWADDGLLDFIDHVADWAQGPIMVIATARAELFEKRPTWGGGKRNATSIYLDPLSAAEGEAMLDDLLPGPIQPELKRDDRRAQRGQSALRRGDRPQADRRRGAPRDRRLADGRSRDRSPTSSSRARSRG